ncbi:TonB-dependent receptor plug domain-containing protein [Ichthyobacterium seriolicida]|uniref:Ferric enterobactin receptor n=1 Tax=Ichthyobacterium seriolicida TaxID=242600 RepID=A0A1J1E4I3_9FLAO|nr:TonB-dependent receptor [Ichthyobacterium seriolicida]BAV94230.1 ferric enterobactin receptor [Ichthyobacterium seriolicida]
MSEVVESVTPSLDLQLSKIVPSYHAIQPFVSDATAFYNPAGLRGLFQSRVLVLVNGKRKNHSAFVDFYEGSSKSEVGVDMSSIPSSAIDRVEVLRDGAAAQYGSDAISGVINIILKKSTRPYVKADYSNTTEGDGENQTLSAGFGKSTEDFYTNFSVFLSRQGATNRAGNVDPYLEYDIFGENFGKFYLKDYEEKLENEVNRLGADKRKEAIANLKEEYTKKGKFDPDKITDRGESMFHFFPRAGSVVGMASQETGSFVFNGGYVLDKPSETKLYSFGTYTARSGSSPQYTRTVYWNSAISKAFENTYKGKFFFNPMMEPKISDKTLTLGLSSTYKEWNIDLSSTYGANRIDYNITNSYNVGLGVDNNNDALKKMSPTDFYIGAHEFNHIVNNALLSRVYDDLMDIHSISLLIGMEQRFEQYLSEKGDPESYLASGAESFKGISLDYNKHRSNFGIFAESTIDITDNLLIGAAGRYEEYSDFGNNFSWKFNTRYKPIDEIALRGAVSTGFRAPTLHQKHYQTSTTVLLDKKLFEISKLDSEHEFLRKIGVPKLTAEKSVNLSLGVGFKIFDMFVLTIDAYMIDLKDRVIMSNTIESEKVDNGTVLKNNLIEYNLKSAQFFLNALRTRTKGVDVVLSINRKTFTMGSIHGRIGFNFNKTDVTKVKLPEVIESSSQQNALFDNSDRSRIENSLPNTKANASITYDLYPISLTADANYVGSVSWKHPDGTTRFKLSPKVFFNFKANFELIGNLNLTLGVVNIFDNYPDKYDTSYSETNSGRFVYNMNQSNLMGRQHFISLKYNL